MLMLVHMKRSVLNTHSMDVNVSTPEEARDIAKTQATDAGLEEQVSISEELAKRADSMVCDGVYYFANPPNDLLEEGLLLTKEDFMLASGSTQHEKSQATYAFNQLVFSLFASGGANTRSWISDEVFFALKDPHQFRGDSFYIATDSAARILEESDKLIGYGSKTIELLSIVIHDEDIYFDTEED